MGKKRLQVLLYETESANIGEKNFHHISDRLSNEKTEELRLFYIALRDGIWIIVQKRQGDQSWLSVQ